MRIIKLTTILMLMTITMNAGWWSKVLDNNLTKDYDEHSKQHQGVIDRTSTWNDCELLLTTKDWRELNITISVTVLPKLDHNLSSRGYRSDTEWKEVLYKSILKDVENEYSSKTIVVVINELTRQTDNVTVDSDTEFVSTVEYQGLNSSVWVVDVRKYKNIRTVVITKR